MTRSVSTALTMEIGPDVLSQVSSAISSRMHREVVDALLSSVPHKLKSVLPYLLDRSLPMALTRQLTRSVTHALVPAVSYGLSRTPEQEEVCRECYNTGARCDKCHSSVNAQYYLSYYSTYYSDYFAEYYQAYYADALLRVDMRQHSRKTRGEKPGSNAVAKKARQHNLGASDFSKPMLLQRGLGPSGIPPDSRIGVPAIGPYRKEEEAGEHWTRPTGNGGKIGLKGEIWGPPTRRKPEGTFRPQ
eukprot:g3533.t1